MPPHSKVKFVALGGFSEKKLHLVLSSVHVVHSAMYSVNSKYWKTVPCFNEYWKMVLCLQSILHYGTGLKENTKKMIMGLH